MAVYTYPNKLLERDVDHMRMLFANMFATGDVHVRVVNQIVSDSYVINDEVVSYGEVDTFYVSIYEVRDGKIQSVRFVRDMTEAF